MPTLVLNVPTWREEQDGARSFESTMATGIGEGFAIASTLVGHVRPGIPVIVLNKQRGLRAEGFVVRLQPTVKTGSGMQRYNVWMRDLEMKPYADEAVNRCGVGIK